MNKTVKSKFDVFYGIGFGFHKIGIDHELKKAKRTFDIKTIIFLCFKYEWVIYKFYNK